MFTLKPLPYQFSSFEPYISARTMELHYSKHHQAYVDNLNRLISGTDWKEESLEGIIMKSLDNPERAAIFNNAGQHYNHEFFWQSLAPLTEPVQASPALQTIFNQQFGSLEKFKEDFKAEAAALFGSGWVWLVKDGEELKIMKMANADNPIARGFLPIFGLDVWEHAYYLDYQNKRLDFVGAVLDNLVNWNFLEEQLKK